MHLQHAWRMPGRPAISMHAITLILCLFFLSTAVAADSTDPSSADYVIVGGGTAGCVLAARLCTAMPGRTVTLLERGAARPPASELRVRAMRHAFTAWKDPALTQTWLSQPNPGLDGREVTVLTGQTLGGSSAIAGGQWTKPPLSTFDSDAWAFEGTPEWCFRYQRRHVPNPFDTRDAAVSPVLNDAPPGATFRKGRPGNVL